MLYLSCHSVAEYDEVKLFNEIDIDVFSHGAYLDPTKPEDDARPSLSIKPNKKLINLARKNPKENMSKEFLDNFNVIFSHWKPEWLYNNWNKIKDKICILRTNGQSSFSNEVMISEMRKEGLKIVRYSPFEKTIPYYAGEDVIIRFYKDPDEFNNWNGEVSQVITVGQNLEERKAFCNFDAFLAATEGFPRKVYGNDNENLGDLAESNISYDRLKQVLRDSRVFFYTGTYPASYTLGFIEAMMTGIPIVAIGYKLGNAPFLSEQCTYEIPFIIRNGDNGFWNDNIDDLRDWIKTLLNSKEIAEKIGQAGRQTAINLFGKDKIKKQWEDFFNRL